MGNQFDDGCEKILNSHWISLVGYDYFLFTIKVLRIKNNLITARSDNNVQIRSEASTISARETMLQRRRQCTARYSSSAISRAFATNTADKDRSEAHEHDKDCKGSAIGFVSRPQEAAPTDRQGVHEAIEDEANEGHSWAAGSAD